MTWLADDDAEVQLDFAEVRGRLPRVWPTQPSTPIKLALLARHIGWDGDLGEFTEPSGGRSHAHGDQGGRGWGHGTSAGYGDYGGGDGSGHGGDRFDGDGYGYGYGAAAGLRGRGMGDGEKCDEFGVGYGWENFDASSRHSDV